MHLDQEGGSELHAQRVAFVVEALECAGATSALDLGCGDGFLLETLAARPEFTRLIGIERASESLAASERRLGGSEAIKGGRLRLVHGSFDVPDPALAGLDAAVMLETIEHIDPRQLSAVEHAQFAVHRPRMVLITTPNREYNRLYGMPEGMLRHADHRFEWTRGKFRAWASGVAQRNGYTVRFAGIGPRDPVHGSPTQVGTFLRSE